MSHLVAQALRRADYARAPNRRRSIPRLEEIEPRNVPSGLVLSASVDLGIAALTLGPVQVDVNLGESTGTSEASVGVSAGTSTPQTTSSGSLVVNSSAESSGGWSTWLGGSESASPLPGSGGATGWGQAFVPQSSGGAGPDDGSAYLQQNMLAAFPPSDGSDPAAPDGGQWLNNDATAAQPKAETETESREATAVDGSGPREASADAANPPPSTEEEILETEAIPRRWVDPLGDPPALPIIPGAGNLRLRPATEPEDPDAIDQRMARDSSGRAQGDAQAARQEADPAQAWLLAVVALGAAAAGDYWTHRAGYLN